ncbi:MAG: CoA pyrophosphatase [Bryobacterales bacterium]|nr:CoA pyrophosphatase [Bryobacterales bacterium]
MIRDPSPCEQRSGRSGWTSHGDRAERSGNMVEVPQTPATNSGDTFAPRAAVAVVHALGPQESVLLIRRASRSDDPWSGQWSFPGGRRDPQDVDLLDTARRELQEECALALSREQCLRALKVTHAGRSSGRLVAVAPYLFQVEEPLATTVDQREAESATWLPLSVLHDPSQHQIHTGPGVPPGMRVPGIALDGVPLWGFTYRVLCSWLGIAVGNPV